MNYKLVIPDRSLYFPTVERIRSSIAQSDENQMCPIIIDAHRVTELDYTAAKVTKDTRCVQILTRIGLILIIKHFMPKFDIIRPNIFIISNIFLCFFI